MFWDVGSNEVQDHCGDVVVEPRGQATSGEGQSVLVAGKTKPISKQCLCGGDGIVGISLECQRALVVHLRRKEGREDGQFWIGGIRGQRDGQGLLRVFTLV